MVWTSDTNWDPSVLDNSISDNETWYDAISDLEGGIVHSVFDEFGNYQHRETSLHLMDVGEEFHNIDDIVDHTVLTHNLGQTIGSNEHQLHCNVKDVKRKPPDYDSL